MLSESDERLFARLCELELSRAECPPRFDVELFLGDDLDFRRSGERDLLVLAFFLGGVFEC